MIPMEGEKIHIISLHGLNQFLCNSDQNQYPTSFKLSVNYFIFLSHLIPFKKKKKDIFFYRMQYCGCDATIIYKLIRVNEMHKNLFWKSGNFTF